MTAQISDSVIYRCTPYSIAGIKGSGLFDPSQQGIEPIAISTACWRGYHCVYEVADDTLLLTELHIGLSEKDRALAERGEGPMLFSKVPRRYTIRGHSKNLRTGKVKTSWESPDFLFNGLQAVIRFSGGLLLGDGFIREMYVHMGFHPAYKFRKVHQLIFENGRLVKEADRSTEMAEFRRMIADRPFRPSDPDNREEIERWVRQCFRLDYKW